MGIRFVGGLGRRSVKVMVGVKILEKSWRRGYSDSIYDCVIGLETAVVFSMYIRRRGKEVYMGVTCVPSVCNDAAALSRRIFG